MPRIGVVLLALLVLCGLYTASYAQYPAPDPRDWGARIFGRTDNPNLACSIQRRINRDGDIVWLQMNCRAVGYGDRDR